MGAGISPCLFASTTIGYNHFMHIYFSDKLMIKDTLIVYCFLFCFFYKWQPPNMSQYHLQESSFLFLKLCGLFRFHNYFNKELEPMKHLPNFLRNVYTGNKLSPDDRQSVLSETFEYFSSSQNHHITRKRSIYMYMV